MYLLSLTILSFLIISVVFVESYRFDYIVKLLKKFIHFRDVFIDISEDIHIGLIEIADKYNGF